MTTYTKEILNNLTNEEKLNALCRSRNIKIEEIVENIIDKIIQSNIEDKAIYTGEHEFWDREYITYTIIGDLYIDYCNKYYKELIKEIKLSEKEKEFLKLAKEMKVNEISIEIMR